MHFIYTRPDYVCSSCGGHMEVLESGVVRLEIRCMYPDCKEKGRRYWVERTRLPVDPVPEKGSHA